MKGRQSIMTVAIKNLLAKLARDEQGGEVLEYALIAGLIVVDAIAIIGAVGTKVMARWPSLNDSMYSDSISASTPPSIDRTKPSRTVSVMDSDT